MPSLNQGAFIEDAINSVLSQGNNVELIIIDGGSTDQSLEIIKKYENKLAYWISEKDNGQSHAINKGLAKITGEIVTWLNSDDLYQPGTLNLVQRFFGSYPQIDLLHGRAKLFGKGKKNIKVGPTMTLEPWEYLPYMRFPQPSAFFRRRVLDKIRPLNENLSYAMDHELVVKAILQGAQPEGIANVLSGYRLHATSKSMKEEPFMQEWSQVFANALFSVQGAENYLTILLNLGLIAAPPDQKYPVNSLFSPQEIQHAFLQHLHLRLHAFYRLSEKRRAIRILNEIKHIDPVFAKKMGYDSYILKMRFIPKFFFRIFRTLRG